MNRALEMEHLKACAKSRLLEMWTQMSFAPRISDATDSRSPE